MNLVNCYHVLGIVPGAPFEDVKAAYRRLARRYHPDVNPDQVEWASQQFIEVTEAYQVILKLGASAAVKAKRQVQAQNARQAQSSSASSSPVPEYGARRTRPVVQTNPQLSAIDNRLKQQSYEQLQQFLKNQRFPRAIALVEGLVQRIPKDPEVQQWQAITYQQWARYLANNKEYRKAQIYLKKALKADPYNRRLWAEVKEEFQRIEKAMSQRKRAT
ncbi:MAG: DnaJ domain-containing protein [Cyanobacteria bacterium P01_F01_bin.150]